MKSELKIGHKLYCGLAISVMVCTVLLPLMVFPLKVMIKEAKKELMSTMDTENSRLTLINFTESDLKQCHIDLNAHELSYKGSMYDIYSVEKKNGIIQILALKDEDENLLFSLFESHRYGQKMNQSGIGIFTFLGCVNLNLKVDINPLIKVENEVSSCAYKQIRIKDPVAQIFAPPPNS